MSDDIEVIESNTSAGSKFDFPTAIIIQMNQINSKLSNLNFTPPSLYQISHSLDIEDLKPNRINFVEAVDGLDIMMESYKKGKDWEQIEEKYKLDEEQDEVKKAKIKYRRVMSLLAKKGLLKMDAIMWDG